MSSSAAALVTTIHLSMLVVRRHRSRPSGADILILFPAVVLSGLVWLVAKPVWIAVGVVAHLVWFAYCEKQYPAPSRPAVRAVAARSTPVPGATAAARGAVLPPSGSPADVARPPGAPTAPSRAPVTVPVLAVFDETPDIRTFRFQRPEGFEFAAGQFLTIRVQVDGKSVQRAYSISSAPGARGYLEISVKRIGLVSGVLHAKLRPGALVTVRPPAGGFVYPAGDDRPLLLLAGGIGITPLMSMLRHAVATEPLRPVTLLYSVRKPEDLAFRDELALVSRRHPQVRIGVCVSQGPASDRWHSGHITPPIVRAYVPDPAHALTCICGPKAMMDAMASMMAGLGVPAPQVRSESFGAAMTLVTAEADEPPAVPRAAGSVLVRFARSARDARVSPADTLLDAAEAHGVDVPSMCRAGTCHTCRTRVLEGEVICESDTLSDEDRAAGYVLPCVSHAQGDCVLEA